MVKIHWIKLKDYPVLRGNDLTEHINNDKIRRWKAKKAQAIHNMGNLLVNTNLDNKSSIDNALNVAQNYLNNTYNDTKNTDKIESFMGLLRAIQSNYKTDVQDPTLMNNYIMDQEKDVLRNRINNSLHPKKPRQTTPKEINVDLLYGSPQRYQNEHYLIDKLKWQIDDELHVKNFDNQYGQMHPGYQKFITSDGATFYFPSKWLNAKGKSTNHKFDAIKWIARRNSYVDRYSRQERLANNQFRALNNIEVNHHWFNYKNSGFGSDNDKFAANANTALGHYQYRTVHDEIWKQYYLDRMSHERISQRDVNKQKSKINRKINHLQRRINHYYYHTTSKKWIQLGNERDQLKAQLLKLNNYQSPKYRHDERKANWWQNQINQRNKNFADYKTKEINHELQIGDIYNIKHDNRYTHFGYIRPRHPKSDHDYLYFMVTDESPAYEVNVSANPVEWGVNVTTGTQLQQTQVSVTGVLFNPNFSSLVTADGQHGYNHDNSDDKTNTEFAGESNGGNLTHRQYWNVRNQAEKMQGWTNGTEMFYSGQEWYPHCLISEFNPDLSNSGDGGSVTTINFSMTLTLCNYFKSNIHKKKRAPNRIAAKPSKGKKSRTNRKRPLYVRVKAGMTYSYIGLKKHVSVGKLERINKWPARRIPVGSMVRIQ